MRATSTWMRASILARAQLACGVCGAQLLTHIDQTSCHRGGGGHGRTHQMGAPSPALPAFEVAVRGRCAALAGTEHIFVHAETHGAAGIAPLESGRGKDTVQSLAL